MIAKVAELLYTQGSVPCELLIGMMVQIHFRALRTLLYENSYH